VLKQVVYVEPPGLIPNNSRICYFRFRLLAACLWLLQYNEFCLKVSCAAYSRALCSFSAFNPPLLRHRLQLTVVPAASWNTEFFLFVFPAYPYKFLCAEFWHTESDEGVRPPHKDISENVTLYETNFFKVIYKICLQKALQLQYKANLIMLLGKE
jgi:hypothetical protein